MCSVVCVWVIWYIWCGAFRPCTVPSICLCDNVMVPWICSARRYVVKHYVWFGYDPRGQVRFFLQLCDSGIVVASIGESLGQCPPTIVSHSPPSPPSTVHCTFLFFFSYFSLVCLCIFICLVCYCCDWYVITHIKKHPAWASASVIIITAKRTYNWY